MPQLPVYAIRGLVLVTQLRPTGQRVVQLVGAQRLWEAAVWSSTNVPCRTYRLDTCTTVISDD